MRFRLRLVPGWRRWILVGAPITTGLALLVAAYAYALAAGAAAPPVAPPGPPLEVPEPPGLLVDVVGAVKNPGLYRLPRGDRVYDAIEAAGGFSAEADMVRVPNLAGRLTDGMQIKVAFQRTASSLLTAKVSLNQATLEELETVPGFSDAFARDCMDYRVNYGGFQSTRELVEVLGMSEADYLVARRYLTL
jgi:competence protein ComEA